MAEQANQPIPGHGRRSLRFAGPGPLLDAPLSGVDEESKGEAETQQASEGALAYLISGSGSALLFAQTLGGHKADWQAATATAALAGIRTVPSIGIMEVGGSLRDTEDLPVDDRARGLRRGGLADWQLGRVREALCGADGSFNLTTLAKMVGLSHYHFCRAFKQSTGLPPRRYQIKLRIERAKDLLARTSLPMSDVAAAVGYEDQSHFAQMFRQGVGVTPSQYRRERRG